MYRSLTKISLLLFLLVCIHPTVTIEDISTSLRNLLQRNNLIDSREELFEALEGSSETEEILIDSITMTLHQPIILSRDNFTLQGSKNTIIVCPDDNPALIINATNIHIQSIQFQGCRNHSAVVVSTPPANVESPFQVQFSDVEFRENQGINGGALRVDTCPDQSTCPPSMVSMERCRFVRNSGIHGGAIFAVRVNLSVEDSAFIRNRATNRGGALVVMHYDSQVEIKSSNFSHNRAEGVSTENSTIPFPLYGSAGVIYALDPSRISIDRSQFVQNRGCMGGGVMELLTGSPDAKESLSYVLSITRSAFLENFGYCGIGIDDVLLEDFTRPHFTGGVLTYFGTGIMNLTWEIDECRFLDNKAHHGGVLALFGTPDTTEKISNSEFRRNQVLGGAGCVLGISTHIVLQQCTLADSQAVFGGGLVLIDEASLTTDPEIGDDEYGTTFDSNTAVYGGAMFMAYTGPITLNRIILQNNRAYRYGGGIRFYDTVESLELKGILCEGNSARVGGSAALLGFGNMTITHHKGQQSIFRHNRAVLGGALYLEIGHFISFHLHVTNALFYGNEVMAREHPYIVEIESGESSYSPIDGLSSAILDRIMSRNAGEDILGRMSDLEDGRGGGIVVELIAMRVYTNAEILFKNVFLRENRGIVGGGMAVFTNDLTWNDGSALQCFPTTFGLDACRLFQFENVTMTRNEAEFAGGLFITNPSAISSACDSDNPLPDRSLIDIVQIQIQVENYLPQNELMEAVRCTHLYNNTVIDGEGNEGNNVATTVHSLSLMDFNGVLEQTASRERLSVSCPADYTNIEECEVLQIAVKDAFNQTIARAIPDSKLEVTLTSGNITGDQRYTAEEGIITINNTLAWGIDIKSSQLEIVSDRQNDLVVKANFSTRACYPGEYISDKECRPCPPDQYGFYPGRREDCRTCEEHGVCKGEAAIVPENGYWHSTPFSPAFSHCIVEEACESETRIDDLAAYYEDQRRMVRELRALDKYLKGEGELSEFVDYQQCVEGYDGIRCGSCVDGYGHSYSGKCKKCPESGTRAIVLATLAIFWIFVFIGANCFITLSSTKARIHLSLQELKPSTSQPLRELRRVPGFKKSEIEPRLTRASTIRETETEDEDYLRNTNTIQSLTQHLVAIVQFTEMVKILFNYLQVTSTALRLHINWTETLKMLLSIEGGLVGVASESLVVPLECNFDKSDNVPPSISALWLRAIAPVLVLILLIFIFTLSWYFIKVRPSKVNLEAKTRLRGEESERPISLLTCLIVITIVAIYFSYLNVFRELLRTLNCVQVEHTLHVEDQNPYLKYAVYQDKIVWAEDTDLTCFKGKHLPTGILGALGVAFSMGVIIFVIAWLPLNRRKLKDPQFIARYWFLYQAYRKEWYTSSWEAVILFRKALIAAVVVFSVHLGSNLQASMCVGILFIAQMLHTIFKPFKDNIEYHNVPEYTGSTVRWWSPNLADKWIELNNAIGLNTMESISLMSSVVVFFTGIILDDSYSSEKGKVIMVVFAVGVNLFFVCFMIYRLYLSLHLVLDHKLEVSNAAFLLSCPNNGSFFSLFAKLKEVIHLRIILGSSLDKKSLSSRNVLPVIVQSHDKPTLQQSSP